MKRLLRFEGELLNLQDEEDFDASYLEDPNRYISEIAEKPIPKQTLNLLGYLTFYIAWIENLTTLSAEDVKYVKTISDKLWEYYFRMRKELSENSRKCIWPCILKFDYVKIKSSRSKSANAIKSTDFGVEDSNELFPIKDKPIHNYTIRDLMACLMALIFWTQTHPYSIQLEAYVNALYFRAIEIFSFAKNDPNVHNHPSYVIKKKTDNETFYAVNEYYFETTDVYFFQFFLKFKILKSFGLDQKASAKPFSCNQAAAQELKDACLRVSYGNAARLISKDFQKNIYECNLFIGERERFMKNNPADDDSGYHIISQNRAQFIDITTRWLRDLSRNPYQTLCDQRDRFSRPIDINYNLFFYVSIDFFFRNIDSGFSIKDYIYFPENDAEKDFKFSDKAESKIMSFSYVQRTLNDIRFLSYPVIICLFNTYYVKQSNELFIQCADIESSIVLFCRCCSQFKKTASVNSNSIDELVFSVDQKLKKLLDFNFDDLLLFLEKEDFSKKKNLNSVIPKILTDKGLIY